MEGQRTELTVRALEGIDDTTRWPVRVLVDGRIRGAGTLSAGSETSLPLPATGSGWVQGVVDADPDALRADDRRYFAYRSRPAPTLAVGGEPELFVTEAVAVLEGSGRARISPIANAELLIASAGSGVDERGPTRFFEG